jgi:hypothetical protein
LIINILKIKMQTSQNYFLTAQKGCVLPLPSLHHQKGIQKGTPQYKTTFRQFLILNS